MLRILSRLITAVASEKDLMKEVRHMVERLKAIDRNPEEQLSSVESTSILGKQKSSPFDGHFTFHVEQSQTTEMN